jgi:hypothetical protein
MWSGVYYRRAVECSMMACQKEKPPDDDLSIETYVGVYIYKSYNKGGFNSASVGV